jgi:hypothetical protein
MSFPNRSVPILLLLAALLAPSRPAGAQAEAPATPPGNIGLDKLLQLPEDLEFDVERRRGLTRSDWLARFDEARASVADARAGLVQAQEKLSQVAGRSDNWSMSPPGLPVEAAESGGDTYRLRDEVRRWRAEIERAEARLRELEIEASLAGVPDSWRGQGTDPLPGNESVTRGPAAR